MAIEYLNSEILKEPIGDFTQQQLAKAIKTGSEGTDMKDVDLLNKDPKILQAGPSVDFDANLAPREFQEVLEDGKKKLPTIAWIVIGEGTNESSHSVLITAVDMSAQMIEYNDPVYGGQRESLKTFLEKWYRRDKILVRIRLGARDIRKLEQFLPKGSR
jgi:hypothetical protein